MGFNNFQSLIRIANLTRFILFWSVYLRRKFLFNEMPVGGIQSQQFV